MIGCFCSQLRRSAVLLLAAGVIMAVPGKAQAYPYRCTASPLRIDVRARAIEPFRANPAFTPCVDDTSAVARAIVHAGKVTVTLRGVYATTDTAPLRSRAEFGLPDDRYMFTIYQFADASIDSATITFGANRITIRGVKAQQTCAYGGPPEGGGANVADLTVNRTRIDTDDGQTVIPIANGTIYLGERVPPNDGRYRTDWWTIRAVRIHMQIGANIVLGEATNAC
jgi:hypothetical protein